MSDRTYEFETTCDATVRERWRVTAPANLDGDELHDWIGGKLHGGDCELISENAEDERDRVVEERTITEAAPDPEPAYTVVGQYGDNGQPYTTTVYTHNGPEAALTLAHDACAEDNDCGRDDVELQVVALFAGDPTLIDFDSPETWPK